MRKQASKTLIGGFVVGAVALAVAGVLVFGSGRFLKQTFKFVMYFEGSVKGLKVGSSVVFRGVRIGTVTDILLRYNPADMSVQIPVIVEIEPDRVEVVGGITAEPDPKAAIGQLVERGLRARLLMPNLVTGQLTVELDFHPEKPIRLVGADTRYPEIPTIPSPLEELSKRIEEVPIEEIFKKLLAAVEGIEEIINSPEVKGIITSLNLAVEDLGGLVRNIDGQIAPLVSSIEKTLRDTRKLVRNIDARVTPLASTIEETVGDYGELARNVEGQIAPLASSLAEALEEVRATLEQGRKTLAATEDTIGEDSPLVYEFDNTLKEVGAAARSIRLLADYLKRHPEALIKGKGKSGGE
jgi:paraquat-inducible protein B